MTTVEFFLDQTWKSTLSIIKESQRFDESIFKSFFENETKLRSLDDDHAVVEVMTFIQHEVLNNEKDFILESIQKVVPAITQLSLVYPNDTVETKRNSKSVSFKNNIDPKFTFDNFIVGPSNKECQSAALACSYSPGKLYNPLFIYGNSGLGKTHLLHAIGNYCLKEHENMKILYIQCSDFVDRVSINSQNNTIDKFKIEMSELDLLLVDDIQFLAGKKLKSQEVFFQIFNNLVQNKKQIVITSDRQPTEITELEERLISRFYSGLSVSVNSPAFDTSKAILKQKLTQQSFDFSLIDEEVLDYLATNFSKDIRKLEGQLNRLLFYGINFNDESKITLQTAISAFKGQASDKDAQEINSSRIKRVVCDYYGITKSQLISKARSKQISIPRHIAIMLHRRHLDWSFAKIGEEFGKRDHSTIINSCEKVEKLLKTDELFKQAFSEIEKTLVSN